VSEFAFMLCLGLERVCCQYFTELLKYTKFLAGNLTMQNLWAKDIVGSISTALCSFLHSDLMCYVCRTWAIFTR